MPKIKTHSGAKKRFKLTKNGKVKRGHAFRSHLLNGHGKTRKLKRAYRKASYADKTNTAVIKRMRRTPKLSGAWQPIIKQLTFKGDCEIWHVSKAL